MSADWKITTTGRGEGSIVRVTSTPKLVAWSMTQAEARALMDALSRVVFMPPRAAGPTGPKGE